MGQTQLWGLFSLVDSGELGEPVEWSSSLCWLAGGDDWGELFSRGDKPASMSVLKIIGTWTPYLI